MRPGRHCCGCCRTVSALAVQPDGVPVAAFAVGSPESPVLVRFRRPTDIADIADIALTLSPDKAAAGPGTLTFTAAVSNAGPAAARGVLLTITTSKAISVPESTQGKVVLATATPDQTVADHQRTVEVLTSRLETE